MDAALASMQKLADEAGLHQVTLARWSSGRANVGPDSARKLAAVLKARGLRITELAARLKALADLEKGE